MQQLEDGQDMEEDRLSDNALIDLDVDDYDPVDNEQDESCENRYESDDETVAYEGTIPNGNGFFPFPNKECAMFSMLVYETGISKRSAQKILDMLHKPKFDPTKLPKRYSTIESLLQGLPLLDTETISVSQVFVCLFLYLFS